MMWLYQMRESSGWWLEWLWSFIPVSIWTSHKCFVKFLLVFDRNPKFQLIYVIYILVRFNHLSMVITHQSNGLRLCFPYISNRSIISCKPLLHWYTWPIGNIRKAQTKSIRLMSYYHREMVEPDKYINNLDKLKLRITIKDK